MGDYCCFESRLELLRLCIPNNILIIDLKDTCLNKMSQSVLENQYVEPTRPYSLNELAYNRERMFKSLRIGKTKAQHNKCGHFYLVKENGRKEKEIIESGSLDTGFCSVCWKVGKTPNYIKSRCLDLIDTYSRVFFVEPKYLTYDLVDLESLYYKWLYENVNKSAKM